MYQPTTLFCSWILRKDKDTGYVNIEPDGQEEVRCQGHIISHDDKLASAAAELVAEREPEPRNEIPMVDTNRSFVGAEGLVRMALHQYTEILTTVSDPRVSDWPLMDSPIPTFVIVVLYLYTVTILGPRLMANRKPFKLRNALVAYNAFQVVFSLGMLYEHLMSGWLLDYSYKCQPVDYSHNPSALRMASLCWWYFISKFTEFTDTIFFILRKKDSQVTFLHMYHHSLTPLETWICVKFIAGGHGTLGNLINNAVHVVMYGYYMLSAMGPEYQKYLWWKKHLTTVQLVQFFLVFVHSAQALVFDCGYPKLIAALLLLHSAIFFALFSDFYSRAYHRQKIQSRTKELKAE